MAFRTFYGNHQSVFGDFGFRPPFPGSVLWHVAETNPIPGPLGFHPPLPDTLLCHLSETNFLSATLGFQCLNADRPLWPVPETTYSFLPYGFHLPLSDTLLCHIWETKYLRDVVGFRNVPQKAISAGRKETITLNHRNEHKRFFVHPEN